MNEKRLYTQKFRSVVEEVVALARGAKTSDYGETWKNTGLIGIYIKIMIKEGRLKQLLWNKRYDNKTETAVSNESIRDTLLDLAAYAVYGVIAYDEQNISGDRPSIIDELQTMLTLEKMKQDQEYKE